MQLDSYLQRVGFRDDVRPSPGTLAEVLRCHVLSVPFENLDVQLGIPVSMDVEAAFDKIVQRGRGGWCYEQNGLLGWALCEIGFDVTRVAAAVRRAERGDDALANHLCLLVRTPDDPDSIYLADAGIGGSMIRPIRLEAALHEQVPFRIGLQRLDDGYWRYEEDWGVEKVGYDFLAEPGDESALAAKCARLQTDPASSFVKSLVVQRRMPEAHISLRGRVLTNTTASGKETSTLQSPRELGDTLLGEFELDIPEIRRLWPRIVKRHEELFGS